MKIKIKIPPNFDPVGDEIKIALMKWEADKEGAQTVIKKIREWAWENELLEEAQELVLHDKGTNEWELGLYIFSSSRERAIKDSIKYAELILEGSPTKACRVIHDALKRESECERLDEIVELCEHEEPLFVKLAHKELRQMAISGNLDALHRMGYSYYWGKSGFVKDSRKAYYWWKKSADQGNEYSMHELSILYIDGDGTRCNYKKAYHYAKASAEAGCPEGICLLGFCLYWGYGTKRDFVGAVDCFQRAIALGEREVAAHNLAERYREGEGVEKDYEKALYYHRMAAEVKYPDSICCLGIMHILGQGIPIDYASGVKLLRRAEKLGSTRARFELGKCYEKGFGVPQNWNKAIEFYTPLAEEDYPGARGYLARLKRKIQRRTNKKKIN